MFEKLSCHGVVTVDVKACSSGFRFLHLQSVCANDSGASSQQQNCFGRGLFFKRLAVCRYLLPISQI